MRDKEEDQSVNKEGMRSTSQVQAVGGFSFHKLCLLSPMLPTSHLPIRVTIGEPRVVIDCIVIDTDEQVKW